MELALISFAALLLLLSGAATPAQAPATQDAHAALMRELFGNGDTAETYSCWSPSTLPKHLGGFFIDGRGRTSLFFDTLPNSRHAGWGDIVSVRTVAASTFNGFSRRQYRTRFGFSNGAYHALAPPAGGPSIKFGWYGS